MPPTSVTLRQPKPVKTGTSVSLACTAEDSNPKTNLVWLKSGEPFLDTGESENEQKGRQDVSRATLHVRENRGQFRGGIALSTNPAFAKEKTTTCNKSWPWDLLPGR